MPISDTPGYPPGHWLEVRKLIVRAAKQAGFTSTIVSENDGQDMIHASIVKNIYHNEVVICDVSSLNPNVMLELGLRMATKKPLIVVFDGENPYPFDIKNLMYADYPKGLHYFKVEEFVSKLATKITQVYEAEQAGSYKPFLSHFNDLMIEPSRLETNTQTIEQILMKLVGDVSEMKADVTKNKPSGRVYDRDDYTSWETEAQLSIFNHSEVEYIDSIVKAYYAVHKDVLSFRNITDVIDIIYDNIALGYDQLYPNWTQSKVDDYLSVKTKAIKKTISRLLTKLRNSNN